MGASPPCTIPTLDSGDQYRVLPLPLLRVRTSCDTDPAQEEINNGMDIMV